MFAVIRTGGKQYRVAPNDIIEIEKIAGEPGDIIQLGEVILLGGDGGPKTGKPTIEGASVAAEVLEQKRDDKIIVFKKKRRQGYRRTKGHRQSLTALRITEILTDGKKPSKTAAAKPQAKKAEPKVEETKATAKQEAKKAEAKPVKKAETKPEAKTDKKPAAKTEEKKAQAKKAPAKKAPAKKAPAKKAPAKKKS